MAHTEETYRTAFLTHLQRAHVGEENVCLEIVRFAETELSDLIQQEVMPTYSGLYSLRDRDFYRELRHQMQIPGRLKMLNDHKEGLYSQTLRRYIEFLESNLNPDTPTLKKNGQSKKPRNTVQDAPLSMVEGEEREVVLTRYERNPALRTACLAHYGYRCQVCGMDFEKVYGALGHAYIEVHHLRPISTFKQSHPVDPVHDLVPLCANCHAMIHRGKERVLTLHELKSCYKGFKYE